MLDVYYKGISEGFDSCDQPNNLSQVGSTLFDIRPVWSWNLIDYLENTRVHLPHTPYSYSYMSDIS